jgi:hypothetical protein
LVDVVVFGIIPPPTPPIAMVGGDDGGGERGDLFHRRLRRL